VRSEKPSPDALSSVGEFGLIARLASLLPPLPDAVRAGIGDDAAAIAFGERTLLATTDALLEGVHFRTDWTGPEDLGWKALAVSLSDIAAMGGRPAFALISLGLSPDTPVSWTEALYRGMGRLSAEAGCPVIGGDTIASPDRISLNLTVLGEAPGGRYASRSGAKPGDLLLVTGTTGDSLAGYHCLKRGWSDSNADEAARSCIRAHRRPVPRLKAGEAAFATGAVTAMMDLSDGLSGDLRRMMERSGIGAVVEESRLPVSDAMRETARLLGGEPARIALQGGEDYELLMAVGKEGVPVVQRALESAGVRATVIGEATGRRGEAWLRRANGEEIPLPEVSWDHFT
jgi:thiamine-monophosphate kinase